MTSPPDRFRLVVVSGGTSDPSSTRILADRIAARVTALASERDEQVQVAVIDLLVSLLARLTMRHLIRDLARA